MMPFFDGFEQKIAWSIMRGDSGFLSNRSSRSAPNQESAVRPDKGEESSFEFQYDISLQTPPPPCIGKGVALKHIGGLPDYASFVPGENHPSVNAWGVFLKFARGSTLFKKVPTDNLLRMRDVRTIPMTKYLLDNVFGKMLSTNHFIRSYEGAWEDWREVGFERLTTRQKEILRILGEEYGNTYFFRRIEPRYAKKAEGLPWRKVLPGYYKRIPPELEWEGTIPFGQYPEDVEITPEDKVDSSRGRMCPWGVAPTLDIGRKMTPGPDGRLIPDERGKFVDDNRLESYHGVLCERIIPGRCARRIRLGAFGKLLISLDWKDIFTRTKGIRAIDDGDAEEVYRRMMRRATLNMDTFAKSLDLPHPAKIGDMRYRWKLYDPGKIPIDDHLGLAGGRMSKKVIGKHPAFNQALSPSLPVDADGVAEDSRNETAEIY